MLEFNPQGATATASASSMLSMLNLNMEAVSRQNFFPPLAALHTMASYPPKTSPMTSASSSATPHGINDILGRPAMISPAATPTLAASLPRFGLGVGPGMYFSPGVHHKLGLGDVHAGAAPHVYWPAVNPLWRERLTAPQVSNQGCMDKDGKKKHTRPTFSGHQIYVLEKTFEQTKYLAGPERAKLAYALGMSESQVKVWFQNRRTKWRKKHAAEMVTAKRKHDTEAEQFRHEDENFDSKRMKSNILRSNCRHDDSSESIL